MHDTAIEMAKRLLVDSIWKSANLEGLGTTFPKTEAILANAPTTTKTEEVLRAFISLCGGDPDDSGTDRRYFLGTGDAAYRDHHGRVGSNRAD